MYCLCGSLPLMFSGYPKQTSGFGDFLLICMDEVSLKGLVYKLQFAQRCPPYLLNYIKNINGLHQ